MSIEQQLEQMIKDLNPKSFVKFIKNRPLLFEWVQQQQNSLNTTSIPETLYCWSQQMTPTICACGRPAIFNTFVKGYRQFCSATCPSKRQKHSQTIKKQWKDEQKLNQMIAARKSTCLERYGSENAALNPEVKEKTRKTNQQRYGADTPFHSSEIQKKISQINLAKLGVEKPFQDKTIQAKAAATFEKNHGESNRMQLARAAWQQQHDSLNPFAVPEVKEKIREYWQKTHGVDHPKQVPQILAKCSDTLMKNYGVKNPAQIGIPPESLLILSTPDLLSENLLQYGLSDLSRKLDVRSELITSYHHRLGLTILPKTSRSLAEDDLYQFLLTLGVPIIRNDRKTISPLELDFLLPDYRLAIEFNGLYWHSEKAGKKDKQYHVNKFNQCSTNNIQLITLWEDEWAENSHIIKKHIAHIVHKTNQVIGARKISIREISLLEANVFLEQHHIQGSVLSSKHSLGAFYDNNLVSVLTSTQLSNQVLSISRWALDQNASYPGLLSKFIKFLSNNFQINQIETIADLRWSLGKSYLASGFILKSKIDPDYQYTDYVIRDHKFNLRKNKIQKRFNIDIENKTERELCEELGFDRIWDCGKLKFVWTR